MLLSLDPHGGIRVKGGRESRRAPSWRWVPFIAGLLTAMLLGVQPVHGAGAAPEVVASIKPVHSLVAGVMEGAGVPALLARGGGSPHSHSLRPSQARMLHGADLIFWVGAELETFLVKPLAALSTDSSKTKAVGLMEAAGVRHSPFRADAAKSGGTAGKDAHNGQLHGLANRKHGTGRSDPHIWLDPGNAQAMVRAIAGALSAADPSNADLYAANRRSMETRIAALDRELRGLLRPFSGRPYLVFHDAYGHFERRYGLRSAGAVTVRPGRNPGARRVKELRETIRSLGAVCVFGEPQYEPRLLLTLVEGSLAKTGLLDPLGFDLPAGVKLYFTLMRRLAGSFASCLDTL